MNLTIKSTSGDKFPVTADPSITVGDLKAIIHSIQDISPDQQRLIFKGHVLKDDKTLASYAIEEGHTLILVKGTKKPATASAAQDKPSAIESKTAPTPAPAAGAPGPAAAGSATAAANPFGSLMGMGSPLAGNPADMQRQLLENPEMMRSVMESPMMQSLLDNPELMQSLIQSNPQMRALMERNPEMAHILNDPAVIRQSMEIARNPDLMREMMRNTDRAMSNIEAHPEGFNALRRMYENIQEPMMDASSSGSSATATVVNPDDPNATPADAPIPNPWSAPAASSSSSSSSSAAASSNPLAGADLSALAGLGANPANVNPDQMLEMLDNPLIQGMMRNMMSNPETMEMMINSNPMARQMMDANPQMRDMFRDPAFLQMMSDPQTLRAMIQMQRAFGGLNAGAGGSAAAAPAANPFSLFGNLPATSGASSGSGSSSAAGAFPYASLFGAPPAAAAAAVERPEIIYREQLAQLNSMGFTDFEANINALVQTGGDIQAAVNRLLGM